MQKNVLILWCAVLLFGSKANGQVSTDMVKDKEIIAHFFDQVKWEEGEAPGDLMIRTALFFLHTPYVGATLEIGEEEQLVVNLRELDCTTFMESCVALSRTLQMRTPNFDSYTKQLRYIRYRNGAINGYLSRLHYTTDWIADNVAKGVVLDVTKEIGGEPFKVDLFFMSSNSDKYKHLKDQPERTARVRQIEKQISRREGYFFIPKAQIPLLQNLIHHGDIICFTTTIPGMDISHIALAYWRGEELTFIHASSAAQKVIVEPISLYEYCQRMSSNTGIVVLRRNSVVPFVI